MQRQFSQSPKFSYSAAAPKNQFRSPFPPSYPFKQHKKAILQGNTQKRMAETAVFNLLANFSLFLQREVNLLSGVREEIEYIRDEFERKMAFLRVADSMEENDLELKVWVKQVRDAAYDTEDVLDKFKLNFAHNHGTGFHGFVRKISFSIKTLKAHYQIAYEVQRIKNRVINISMGHQSREYNGYVYDLQPLSPQESWTLLCKKTFQENNCPSHLEGLLTSILRRCEGLPLAIVAISGLLSEKDQSSVAEWEKTYQSLGAELEGNNRLLGMKKILSLSYIDLPHYLKLCFLYLSVFPEDHLIEHWRLIWLWIAEGFVEVKEGAPIEQVAEGYLNELVNRSLIQIKRIEAGDSGGRCDASS
ncbi:hypothetical protein ACSBR1_037997 [Camellia fascicularis]